MRKTRTRAAADMKARAHARLRAKTYNLGSLYSVEVFNPARGRRECVFVAFGMVNSFWAQREISGVYPAHAQRLRPDLMLKQALGII